MLEKGPRIRDWGGSTVKGGYARAYPLQHLRASPMLTLYVPFALKCNGIGLTFVGNERDDAEGFFLFCSPLVSTGSGSVGGVAVGACVPASVISGSFLVVVERAGLSGLVACIGVVSGRMGGKLVGFYGCGSADNNVPICWLGISRVWIYGGSKIAS
ncbi:hypothetical protein Tco_0403360 [Tanacetum coccineum]